MFSAYCMRLFVLLLLLSSYSHAIVWRGDIETVESQQTGVMKNVGKVLYSPLQIFGGSCILIDKKWVLTSRHGTDKWDASFLKLKFPALTKDKVYQVKTVHLHPKHDIALLELKRSVRGSEKVDFFTGQAKQGELVQIGGFGMSGKAGKAKASGQFFSGHNRVDKIRKNKISISLSRPDHEDSEPDEATIAVFDSGSPLFLKKDTSWVLGGIASTASKGKNPTYGSRGSYARVSQVVDWIEKLKR